MPADDQDPTTLYERVGGIEFFERLVDAFYEGVATDPVLLPMYPEPTDLAPARRRLTLFLAQYWGGPTTYSDERGHPMLRARHLPFPIDRVARDHWLRNMAEAVDRTTSDTVVQQALLGYFVRAAEAMRNDTGLPISSSRP